MAAFCPDASDYGTNLFMRYASIISHFMYHLCCKMLPPRPQIQMQVVVPTLYFLHRMSSELTHQTIFIQPLFTCLYFWGLTIFIKHVLKFEYVLCHIPNNQHFQCLCGLSTKLSSLEQIPRRRTIPYYGVPIQSNVSAATAEVFRY
jgi:hypothetical protein